MPITYDKKYLKWLGTLDKKNVRKHTIIISLYNLVKFLLVLTYVHIMTKDYNFGISKILIYLLIGFIIFFVSYYFSNRRIKSQKKLYDESIAYWKEHDPSYLDGIIDKT